MKMKPLGNPKGHGRNFWEHKFEQMLISRITFFIFPVYKHYIESKVLFLDRLRPYVTNQ